jgi:hypothetical protein
MKILALIKKTQVFNSIHFSTHAKQQTDRVNSPDEQLVDSESYRKRTDHDDQHLDWESNLPLHNVKGDEYDHRLVEKEVLITPFPAVLEPFVGVVQETHPDVNH